MAVSNDSGSTPRRHKSDSERKDELSSDPWIKEWSNKHVVCGGCEKTLRLDQRREWYPFPGGSIRHHAPKYPMQRVGVVVPRHTRRVMREAKALDAAREAAKFHAKAKSISRRTSCAPIPRKGQVYLEIDVDIGEVESEDDEATEDEAQSGYEGSIGDQQTDEDITAAWILANMKHNSF